MNDIAETCVQY